VKCSWKLLSSAGSNCYPNASRVHRFIQTRETAKSVKNPFFKVNTSSNSSNDILKDSLQDKQLDISIFQLIIRVSCSNTFYSYGDDNNERQ